MYKLLLLVFLIGAVPFASQAQDDVAPFEIFGGYSYLRTGSPYDENSHGWNTSVAANLTRYVAVKGISAAIMKATGGILRSAEFMLTIVYTFLFGPQFNFRATERVNPFVHALFGAAHDRTTARLGSARAFISDTGFAMALGGGLDAKLNDTVSFRVFQTDYLLTRYRDPNIAPLDKRNVHRFRLSTGLVIH